MRKTNPEEDAIRRVVRRWLVDRDWRDHVRMHRYDPAALIVIWVAVWLGVIVCVRGC